jgi:carbon-monoxide dehydrogenase medium subunit
MKLRLATPATLVDLGRIPGLAGIERDGDGLRIGALTTHDAVAISRDVDSTCPVLSETAGQIGDQQVRNRGTIGGSVAHADPGADYPTVLTALGATIAVTGPDGGREIPAGDFFTGIFETALQPGEIVTSVFVPTTKGAAYVKHAHPASGYAVVGVAAVVEDAKARVAIGGVTGTPVQAALDGGKASPEEIEGAVAAALTGAIGDTYASGEYRTHLATVLAGRALATAFERA